MLSPLKAFARLLLGSRPASVFNPSHPRACLGSFKRYSSSAQRPRSGGAVAGPPDTLKEDALWKKWEETIDKVNKLKLEGDLNESSPDERDLTNEGKLDYGERLKKVWQIYSSPQNQSFIGRYTECTTDVYMASFFVLRSGMGEDKKKLATAAMDQAMSELPGLTWEYEVAKWKRMVRVADGLNILSVFNGALILILLRLLLPRILAMTSMADLSNFASSLGLPSKDELLQYLAYANGLDYVSKFAAVTGIFIVDRLLLVADFTPFGVILPTISPVLFGSVFAGVLTTASAGTVASSINFFLGRNFLAEKITGFSLPNQRAIGESGWFKAVNRRFDSSEFPGQFPSEGFKSSLLLTLAPVLPIPRDLHWALIGTTPVKYSEFVSAHFIGLLKPCFVDAFLGDLLLKAVTNTADVEGNTRIVLGVETTFIVILSILVSNTAISTLNTMMSEDGVDMKAMIKVSSTLDEDKVSDEDGNKENVLYRRS